MPRARGCLLTWTLKNRAKSIVGTVYHYKVWAEQQVVDPVELLGKLRGHSRR